MSLFLSIDFGTSHIRAAVGGGTGMPLAVARRPVAYFRPPGGPDAALEFDTESAWQIVCEAVREALTSTRVASGSVRAVAVTSQRLGLVLYGRDGIPIYAGPNRDLRAVFQGGEIDVDAGNDIWQLTGHGPGFLTAWAKLLWFKQEAPDTYKQVRSASSIADWLVQRMTGVLLMEAALGVESGLALVATGQPAEALAHVVGCDEIDLPPACHSGTVIDKLTSQAAAELGLPAGIPVVAAGPDTQAGLIGLGVCDPDSAGIIAGWSAAVQRVTPMPVFDDTRSMWTGRHTIPDRWVLEGNAGDMGGAYDWLASMISNGGTTSAALARLDRVASAEPIGARGASAYLGPSFVNISQVGLRTGGIVFPVPLAFEPPTRGSIARAVLESFTFALRFNLDRLGTFGGPVRRVAIGGGMVKTKTFREILAAVLGGRVAFSLSGESTSLGALSLAAAAVGESSSLSEIMETRHAALSTIDPSPADVREYDELYHSWRHRERRLLQIDI